MSGIGHLIRANLLNIPLHKSITRFFSFPVFTQNWMIRKMNQSSINYTNNKKPFLSLSKGHELKVGKDFGFQEVVMRAEGRYDLHWKINGNPHFLDKKNLLDKFLPFVHGIFGK